MGIIVTTPYITTQKPYIPPVPYSRYRITDIISRDYTFLRATQLYINDISFVDTSRNNLVGTAATLFTVTTLPFYTYPSGSTYEVVSDGQDNTTAAWTQEDIFGLILEYQFSQPFTLQYIRYSSASPTPAKLSVYGFNGIDWEFVGTIDVSTQADYTVSYRPLIPPGPSPTAINLLSKPGNTYPQNDLLISPTGNVVYLRNVTTAGTVYETYTDMTGRNYPTDTYLYAECYVHRKGCGIAEVPSLVSQSGFSTAHVSYRGDGVVTVLNSTGTINYYTTVTFDTGDIISLLYDRITPSVTIWKNGAPIITVNWDVTDGIFGWRSDCLYKPAYEINGGQQSFIYEPPPGYKPWIFV